MQGKNLKLPYFSVHSRLWRERQSKGNFRCHFTKFLFNMPTDNPVRVALWQFLGMVYPLSFCGSGGKYLKLAGTPSSNRRLSGAVGRYRIGLLTRFQGHHNASDRCLRHIAVLANFIGSMMAMWLSLHSTYKKKNAYTCRHHCQGPTNLWRTTP